MRTGEDEDPIGVMTVLNTQQHKQQPFMGQIKDFMLSKCKDAAVKERISKVSSEPPLKGHVGMLLVEGSAMLSHQAAAFLMYLRMVADLRWNCISTVLEHGCNVLVVSQLCVDVSKLGMSVSSALGYDDHLIRNIF